MITKKPLNNNIHLDTGDGRYMCNQACEAFPQKLTKDYSKVTCQNCLRFIRKHNLGGAAPIPSYDATWTA